MDTLRKQAVSTFSRIGCSGFEDNLKLLMSTMDKLSKEDVGLDVKLMRGERPAPVTYVNIHEHEKVGISMFVLRKNSSLPLHDHPLMYGLIKVVSGSVEIQNYSLTEDPTKCLVASEILAKKETPLTISENDPPVLLTPSKGNIHEITCRSNSGAAFVDVLAPPYGSLVPTLGPRPCFYYFESADQPSNPQLVKFFKCQEHPEFWTDVAPYLGE